MKQTIDALTLVVLSVFLSSLTVYGALGIDPSTTNQPQTEIKR